MSGRKGLRAGSRLGKYRIVRRIGQGGYADVYQARDTVEGVDVALKLPLPTLGSDQLQEFRREARMVARLEHPNILPLKNADMIDGRFVIAYRLGEQALSDRIDRRVALRTALDWCEQMLEGLAYAHEHNVIHCDVKPDNLILFPDGTLKLTDFGIARVAARTVLASVIAGTVGYMSPEQAMGQPSAKSDVFSAGLVMLKLLTGKVPVWPFEWPPPGIERLHRSVRELLPVLERALQVEARRRYRDAGQFLAAFVKAKRQWQRRGGRASGNGGHTKRNADWRAIRVRQLRRRFGRQLDLRFRCGACHQPVDERMQACPWCGVHPLVPSGETAMPATCPRCERGVKLDWKYCAWCHGAAIGPASERSFSDRRYTHKCGECRGPLMPHSRYCPWCRAKVRRTWSLGDAAKPCLRCRQPVSTEFWDACPWCAARLPEGRAR